ncbi:MAG: hypothetical protein SF162_08810 [bacterium]|nr:hypothetical protein [bacterium]
MAIIRSQVELNLPEPMMNALDSILRRIEFGTREVSTVSPASIFFKSNLLASSFNGVQQPDTVVRLFSDAGRCDAFEDEDHEPDFCIKYTLLTNSSLLDVLNNLRPIRFFPGTGDARMFILDKFDPDDAPVPTDLDIPIDPIPLVVEYRLPLPGLDSQQALKLAYNTLAGTPSMEIHLTNRLRIRIVNA